MHFKVTVIYLSVFYILPTFIYYLIGGHTNFKTFEIGVKFYSVLIIIFYCSFLSFCFFKKLKIRKNAVVNIFNYNISWLSFGLICLPFAVYFNIKFGLTFRQSGAGLSEAGLIPKLVVLIKPIFTAYVCYHFFSENSKNIKVKITKVLILFFFVLTLSSSFEGLLLFLLGLNIFIPKLFNKVFIVKRKLSFKRKFFSTLRMVVITFFVLGSIIYIGIANKVGVDGARSYFSNNTVITKLSYYLYYRLSVYNSSLAIHLDSGLLDFDKSIEAALILSDNINYRLQLILGGEPVRPRFTNINRYNYMYTHSNPTEKETGASPGIFASFLISFPGVLMPFICGGYLGMLLAILSKIKPGFSDYEYSWVSSFFVYYFMFTFLHSPINNFFTIGPEPLKLLLYFQTLLIIGKKNKIIVSGRE